MYIQLGKDPFWIVWNKASSCKAALYVFFCYRSKEGLAKCTEEIYLADVVDMRTYQRLDLATVRLLQWPKAADIKWLEEVGGMRRHTECDDIVALAVELKFSRVVALMPIKDQQPVCGLHTTRYMMVEVLDPIQAYLIGSPAIRSRCNTPVRQKTALFVPVGQVVLCSQDDEWRNSPAKSIHALNDCSPLAVARLG